MIRHIFSPMTTSLVFKLLKTIFVLFTIYQVSYGTLQNIQHSLGAGSTNHFFHYGIVTAYLDFWRQPQLPLTIHSICGGLYLLACLLQTTTLSHRFKFHRYLGYFTIINSFIASSMAIWLSYRTLYGTEVIYLFGTLTWFFFTFMTILRALQKQWISHSRWGHGLQQVGIMFVTTRIFSPIYLWFGASVADSYHWGVWSAGSFALLYFGVSERFRQNAIRKILEDDFNRKDKLLVKDDTLLTFRSLIGKAFFFALGTAVFIGAPLLRYTNVLTPYVTLEAWLKLQTVVICTFYLSYMTNTIVVK